MCLRKRLPADLPQVIQLLESLGLPADGLEATEGWVMEDQGQITGHVALEETSDAAVLRSLAVDPRLQGMGRGGQLLSMAEAAAQGRIIVLRTQTIGPWMKRQGYIPSTLAQVPESVRETTQFSGSLCASTPIYRKP